MELNPIIIEGNKILAEQDGWKINPHGGYSKGSRLLLPEDMKYHSSWGWLMPYISVVESLGYPVDIYEETCYIEKAEILITPRPDFEPSENNRDEAKRASVWYALVQFTKWYQNNIKHI